MNKKYLLALMPLLIVPLAQSCNSVDCLIYTALEDYRIADLETELGKQFPGKKIVVQYLDTGALLAKLQSEGTSTQCDIAVGVEATNIEYLIKNNENLFEDLSSYDTSKYIDSVLGYQTRHKKYHIFDKEAGSIIINTKVLQEKGLAEPTSFADLLDEKYKDLIMMPNPKSSGTGYYFYNGLVSSWGQEQALTYFDSLSKNIKEFSSSGSGPVKALDRGQIAIGLGMTFQAAQYANNNSDLKIKYFDEGSPYSLYTMSVINGKLAKNNVKEVYDWIFNTWCFKDKQDFCPETIYKEEYQPKTTISNYPENVKYMDMQGIFDPDYKTNLLNMWKW